MKRKTAYLTARCSCGPLADIDCPTHGLEPRCICSGPDAEPDCPMHCPRGA